MGRRLVLAGEMVEGDDGQPHGFGLVDTADGAGWAGAVGVDSGDGGVMPDPNITDHIRLTELRHDLAHAKAERRAAALDDDLERKLKWMNELYRLSAEIVRLEKRLGKGTP